jgi:hypothetical protein
MAKMKVVRRGLDPDGGSPTSSACQLAAASKMAPEAPRPGLPWGGGDTERWTTPPESNRWAVDRGRRCHLALSASRRSAVWHQIGALARPPPQTPCKGTSQRHARNPSA